MRRKMAVLSGLASVFILLLGPVWAQRTENFKMRISGSASMSGGTGENEYSVHLCAGFSDLYKRVGSRHGFRIPGSGNFTCSTAGNYNPEPTSEWTPHDDCMGAYKVEHLDPELTHVIRFADGDVMYWVLDHSQESYCCYFGENHFSQTVHWLIIGGSGRFEGATGTATWVIPFDQIPVGDPADPLDLIPIAYDGVAEGTIVYAD